MDFHDQTISRPLRRNQTDFATACHVCRINSGRATTSRLNFLIARGDPDQRDGPHSFSATTDINMSPLPATSRRRELTAQLPCLATSNSGLSGWVLSESCSRSTHIQVRAHALNLRNDEFLAGQGHCLHSHNRGAANDDSKRGQRGAQFIGAERVVATVNVSEDSFCELTAS